jgi:L-fuculose-phosphate aldolase
MRNHGVVLTGASIEEATIYAVLLERAARLQVTASQVGKLTSSTASEIEGKGEQDFYPKNINNFWEYLVRKLRKNEASGLRR